MSIEENLPPRYVITFISSDKMYKRIKRTWSKLIIEYDCYEIYKDLFDHLERVQRVEPKERFLGCLCESDVIKHIIDTLRQTYLKINFAYGSGGSFDELFQKRLFLFHYNEE